MAESPRRGKRFLGILMTLGLLGLLGGAGVRGEAASVTDAEAQAAALDVCAVLVGQGPEGVREGGALVRACRRARMLALRCRAVLLAVPLGLDLLEAVAALLAAPD